MLYSRTCLEDGWFQNFSFYMAKKGIGTGFFFTFLVVLSNIYSKTYQSRLTSGILIAEHCHEYLYYYYQPPNLVNSDQ